MKPPPPTYQDWYTVNPFDCPEVRQAAIHMFERGENLTSGDVVEAAKVGLAASLFNTSKH